MPPIQIRLALGAEFDPFPNMRSDPPVFQSGTLAKSKVTIPGRCGMHRKPPNVRGAPAYLLLSRNVDNRLR
jgi:hypothetical protein